MRKSSANEGNNSPAKHCMAVGFNPPPRYFASWADVGKTLSCRIAISQRINSTIFRATSLRAEEELFFSEILVSDGLYKLRPRGESEELYVSAHFIQ